MGQHGIFIAIEGTAGANTDLQLQLLAARLRDNDYNVEVFSFPRLQEPASYYVQQYENGYYGAVEQVGPYTSSLFYALDHYHAGPSIRHALEQGAVVLASHFSSSVMSQQGTQFIHAEERRGFYMWLDNLEFQLLGIPRPHTTVVLRVPAEIVKQQTAQKVTKDPDQLQRSTEIYDEICELFPRDFVRLDGARGGKLLRDNTIAELLWQHLEPLLPPKPKKSKDIKAAVVPAAPVSISSKAYQALSLKQASELLLAQLAAAGTNVSLYFNNDDGSTGYFIPSNLNAKTKPLYSASMDRLFDYHQSVVAQLVEHLEKTATRSKGEKVLGQQSAFHTQACAVARPMLPVATTSLCSITAPAQSLQAMIDSMLSSELLEARSAGQALLLEARGLLPTPPENSALPKPAEAAPVHDKLPKLAKQYLDATYSSESERVQLLFAWPRNEFDLLADILYAHSTATHSDIQHAIDQLPISEKIAVFEAYWDKELNHSNDAVLQKIHYTWEAVEAFGVLRALQQSGTFNNLVWQQLTPRYGYDIPALIDEAGLGDAYEAAFDLSLQLHSQLQTAGYGPEAQYATLLGHRCRWQISLTGQQLFTLLKQNELLKNHHGLDQLLHRMSEQVAEVHPGLANIFH